MIAPEGAEFYLDAFWTLNAGRQFVSSMGGIMPCGIPYSEIRAYAEDAGLHDRNLRRDFVTIMQAMDGGYIEAVTERMKTTKK